MTTTPFLRPQQHTLIDLVTSTPKGTCTAVEAGTGTGKSRACMVSAAQSGSAIIATATKALSHQYRNELPLLRSHYPGTTFKVLSGKRAMGCQCPRYARKHSANCPWPAHLKEARDADVVITNFALLAVTVLGLLPEGLGSRTTVILDEAHEFAAPREQAPPDPPRNDDNVYWQPNDITDLLLDHHGSYGPPPALACISATLNASSPMAPVPDPFALRAAGIPVRRTATLPTPFDWSRQLDLRHVRVPDSNWSEFALDAATSADNRGKLFITRSHREKEAVAAALAAYFPVLMQAAPADASPSQARDIAHALNTRPNLCVVGTDTLMTGLDVPGDALGNIIICGPPVLHGRWTDLDEARLRMSRTGGTNLLQHYLIPNRAMRLTQAIGRGVRSTTDHATVVVGCSNPVDEAVYAAAEHRFQLTPAPASATA